MMKQNFGILPLISAIVLTFASCSEKFITTDGSAWATTYHIVYSGGRDLSDSIEAQIVLVDNELSMFNPASAVSAVNAGLTDTVDFYFRAVFDCAAEVSALSDGRYDPTVAPLVDLWGFGRTDKAAAPSDSLIGAVLESIGIADCSIDAYGALVRKSPETDFDFSSLAKGFGVDCVADMLERNGCSDYMVEIGGEIRVRGTNPRGEKWRIQIDDPRQGTVHSRYTVLPLGPERTAVATSGNYRNYRADSAGNIYGHTISPIEGRPIATEVLSATVVAPSCMLADALATACMTGSASQAEALIVNAGAAAMLIVAENGNDISTKKIGCLTTTENP